MNEMLSCTEKMKIDIDILDPRDMLIEFDFAEKDIDNVDINQPLYESKGMGIHKALNELMAL